MTGGYDFIVDLQNYLNNNNIFKYTITGSKALALSFMVFSIIKNYVKGTSSDKPFGNREDWFRLLSLFFLVALSDHIIVIIETWFSNLNAKLNENSTNDLFDSFIDLLSNQYDSYLDGADNSLAKLAVLIQSLPSILGILIAGIFIVFIKIGDMSLTIGYLLSRLFLVEVMKFIFPIVVAVSTLDIQQTSGIIMKWAKLYFALILLGIIYIGVISFSNIVFKTLANQFIDTSTNEINFILGGALLGSIISGVVAFSTKSFLFRRSTDFIIQFFSS